jgi:uncharacterized protein YdaU (DUF1376 family)
MSHHPWMPFYVADYLADTGHLSTLEHGAYLLLIMHYWRRGGLPDNDAQLARVCHVSEAEWQDIRSTLAALFDAEWKHKRIEAELVRSEARSAAGKAGASARYCDRNATALRSHSHRSASHSHNHKEREESNSPTSELETVLDTDHAGAVIDHRRRIRKPLTVHAAKLLAGKFAKCADPNAAADAMIANGWQGFEPEWLENRTHGARPNGTGPPKTPTGSAKLTALLDTPLEETYDRRRDPKLIASSVRTIRDR